MNSIAGKLAEVLAHVQRRLPCLRCSYITKVHLRAAIRDVVNAIFRERQVHIWGEGTTACASDSKKFGAWDQNLMTEWQARYGGWAWKQGQTFGTILVDLQRRLVVDLFAERSAASTAAWLAGHPGVDSSADAGTVCTLMERGVAHLRRNRLPTVFNSP